MRSMPRHRPARPLANPSSTRDSMAGRRGIVRHAEGTFANRARCGELGRCWALRGPRRPASLLACTCTQTR